MAQLTPPGGTNEFDYVYFGDPDTDGSWRFTVDGTALSAQKRETGSWVEKGAFTE